MSIRKSNTALFRHATASGTGFQPRSTKKASWCSQTQHRFGCALPAGGKRLVVLAALALSSAWGQATSVYNEKLATTATDGTTAYSTPPEDWNTSGWTHVVSAGRWWDLVFSSGGTAQVLFYN